MSKEVPSAESIIQWANAKEKQIIIEAMKDYARLHCEAMAKEIAYNMFDTKYRDIVMKKAQQYIKQIT